MADDYLPFLNKVRWYKQSGVSKPEIKAATIYAGHT
jgi:hypothetical protein